MRIFLVLLPVALLCSACSVTQKVFLQNTEVTGPLTLPPVQVTKDRQEGNITLSLSATLGKDEYVHSQISGHTRVNSSGIFQLDTLRDGNAVTFKEAAGANTYTFQGDNFLWRQPGFAVSAGLDFAVSKGFSLSIGGDFCSTREDEFWGGRIGFGIVSEGKNAALRIDLGGMLRSRTYLASTVVITRTTFFSSTTESADLYNDRGRSTAIDLFGGITINSKAEGWPLQFFFNGAIARQRVFAFEPSLPVMLFPPLYVDYSSQSELATFTTTTGIFTPGVFLDITGSSRILMGVRYVVEVSDNDGAGGKGAWIPFLQCDLIL
jgi:hypothetical protein